MFARSLSDVSRLLIFEQGDEMSYRSGLQMVAIMTNWKTEFHKPLTRPGVKHNEEMSTSTPQAHRGYINSSLLESDLKMSESHANVHGKL